VRTFQFALLWLGNFETSGCLVGRPICAPATTTLTPQLVGITATTYNPSPYIGSQTFLWSLVQVSSKLFSFPCTLSAKCVFLGLHHQSVRRVYGTSTLLLKYSFTGLLPTSVLESLWRLISKHLTWVPCGNWTDRRRHIKTLSFFLSSSSFFATWNASRTVQRLHEFSFTTKLVIAAWLMNSIEIFSAAQIDKLNGLIQTLAAWLTNFFDIFVPLTFFLTICKRSHNSTTSRILRQTFAETNMLFWQIHYCDWLADSLALLFFFLFIWFSWYLCCLLCAAIRCWSSA